MNNNAIINSQSSAHIFTYWEPKESIPYYIQLCMQTWKKFLPDFPITILDNSNLKDYIDINFYGSELFGGSFTLPQIADAVRVMILKEYGGIWFDADTLILNNSAADYFDTTGDNELMFFGFPRKRGVQLAVIHTKSASTRCMRLWVEYIKDKVQNFNPPQKDFWAYLGNSFINIYSKAFPDEIKIFDREEVMLHLGSPVSEYDAYRDYFFLQKKH